MGMRTKTTGIFRLQHHYLLHKIQLFLCRRMENSVVVEPLEKRDLTPRKPWVFTNTSLQSMPQRFVTVASTFRLRSWDANFLQSVQLEKVCRDPSRCFKNICTRISSVDHLYMYRINLSLMLVKLDFQWFSPRRPCVDFWNPPFGLSSQPLVGGMEVGDSATVREAQWDFEGGGWMGIIGIYWYTVI